ncbi:hypothetical protein [Streptomyces sp. NPDC050759]|uniref:hypothetical protein n=1 Tax=Streptomyces sp. NPDC050759 TaxID=3365635 RepID=UPI003789D155
MFAHIDRYGEVSARRLFTGRFVDQVTRLSGLGHLNLGYTVNFKYGATGIMGFLMVVGMRAKNTAMMSVGVLVIVLLVVW